MKVWQGLVLGLAVVVAAGYLGRDGMVRAMDRYAYEPILSACASVLGLLESSRLEIELRSYCNVHMVEIASAASDAAASEKAP